MYKKFPAALQSPPPEGPNSGILVILDEEAEPTCCFGTCYSDQLPELPFPQNKNLKTSYTTSTGQGSSVSYNKVVFIPVLNQPLSSNLYYAIQPRGSHIGSPSQGSGGSSVKEKSSGELRETEIKRIPTTEISSPVGQKRGSESSATAASEWAVAKDLEPSLLEKKAGNEELDRMCVDRIPSGPVREELEEAQMLIASTQGGPSEQMGLIIAGPQSQMLEDKCFNLMGESESNDLKREPTSSTQPGMKQIRKKWKRAAREVQKKSKAGLLASPLQRKMIANLSNMKAPNRNSPPFSPSKSSPKNYSDKGKINMRTKSLVSPQSQSNQRSPNSDRNINGGIKRRVVFESPEDVRNPKKGKVTENDSILLISSSTAEPAEQARREP
ncbi:hypothetical protein Q3G72_025725 [Acer saccharum]|nr:hypothetical protein Q3G72_025725 [Acer saccharum]